MIIKNLDVVKIFDKITNLEIKDYKINQVSHKYSNTKIPIYKLIVNDNQISRNNNINVVYKCYGCKLNNTISLNLFIRKLNKNNVEYCNLCKNNNIDKRQRQSIYMKEHARLIQSGIKIKEERIEKSLDEKIKESDERWKLEDEDFKVKYNSTYITNDEFNNIKEKIKSINNNSIIELNNDWEYKYNFICNNQTKYNPVLINKEQNIVVKPNYITLCCENCDENFITKELMTLKNKTKILCHECSFCNRTFKIKYIKINGNKIKYNSNYELRFIKWCNENNININNGPIIEYTWNGKHLKYYVDFEITHKDKKYLLEFKDNHIWHKMQVENGKFTQKNVYTIEWCKENNYIFKIVFPRNLSKIKKMLNNPYKI